MVTFPRIAVTMLNIFFAFNPWTSSALGRLPSHSPGTTSSIALKRRDRVCPTQRTSSTAGIEGSLSDLARHSSLAISMTHTKLIAHLPRIPLLGLLLHIADVDPRFQSSLGLSQIASNRILEYSQGRNVQSTIILHVALH